MAQVEGIIFGDLFITNKELFVEFFTQYYNENEADLRMVTLNLQAVLQKYTLKALNKEMAAEFKVVWERFQKEVLLNQQDLQLIVAYRGGQGGKEATFSQILKQSDVEGTMVGAKGASYGIVAGDNLVKESMEYLKASDVERFLQKHLNDYLTQLESVIDREAARKLHLYHEYALLSYLQNTSIHLTKKHWYEAFYSQNSGHYFGGQGLGQAYDAYMNHMANKERGIYDFLVSNGLKDNLPSRIMEHNKTVYQEEGGVERTGNFPWLLAASRNHTGWYTGGDIVIVSPETMQVVYNIQLKTTTAKNPSVFAERVEKIRDFINEFVQIDPRKKAELLFDFMLTSISNYDDFNSLPQQEVDQLIMNNLSKYLTIH